MVTKALLVRVEAKRGKEEAVASFLRDALPVVEGEAGTVAWFAIRFDVATFGIFDAFPDEAGRKAHLAGQVAATLMAKADELLERPPSIDELDVLATKLPGDQQA